MDDYNNNNSEGDTVGDSERKLNQWWCSQCKGKQITIDNLIKQLDKVTGQAMEARAELAKLKGTGVNNGLH